MTLREIALVIMEECAEWDTSNVSMTTAINLYRIASGDMSDFVIFDNAGGMPFTIWSGRNAGIALEESFKQYIHAYRIDGKEVIIKEPVIDKSQRWIHWVMAAEER